jgi:hypothetical protein
VGPTKPARAGCLGRARVRSVEGGLRSSRCSRHRGQRSALSSHLDMHSEWTAKRRLFQKTLSEEVGIISLTRMIARQDPDALSVAKRFQANCTKDIMGSRSRRRRTRWSSELDRKRQRSRPRSDSSGNLLPGHFTHFGVLFPVRGRVSEERSGCAPDAAHTCVPHAASPAKRWLRCPSLNVDRSWRSRQVG